MLGIKNIDKKFNNRNVKIVAKNKKALHNYHVIESLEVGVLLKGTEVKSLRNGKVHFTDSFASIQENEVWLENMHISPYDKTVFFNHEPRRKRKLLLHRHQIKRLLGKVKERGYTLVPLILYFDEHNRAKMELALCKGKHAFDKSADIAKRDSERDMQREMKH